MDLNEDEALDPVVQADDDDQSTSIAEAEAARVTEQKRLDDAISEQTRQRQDLRETNAKLLEAIDRLQAVKVEPPKEDQPPARDDFTSFEEYLEAARKYDQKQILGHVEKLVKQTAETRAADLENFDAQKRMRTSLERGAETYPDFADRVKQIPEMPQAALLAWQELPEPEHVAHYLGTHLDEAKRIALMPPGRATHAVYQLEERLGKERAERKASPEGAGFGPMAPAAATQVDPDKMSMDQYAKWRTKQMVKAAKG